MAPPSSIPPAELSKLIHAVTSKFGLNKCKECSISLAELLKDKGIKGERMLLAVQGSTRGFIVMKKEDFRLPFSSSSDAISETGKHFGLKTGGKIYCNVFRKGIAQADWHKQFDCDTHKFTVSTIERF